MKEQERYDQRREGRSIMYKKTKKLISNLTGDSLAHILAVDRRESEEEARNIRVKPPCLGGQGDAAIE